MGRLDLQHKREKRERRRRELAHSRREAEDRRVKNSSARERFYQAASALSAGDTAEALRLAEAALRVLPEDLDGHWLHFRILVRRKAPGGDLLVPLRAMYRLGDRSAEVLWRLAGLEILHGDLEAGGAHLAEVRRLSLPPGKLQALERDLLARRSSRPAPVAAPPGPIRRPAKPAPPTESTAPAPVPSPPAAAPAAKEPRIEVEIEAVLDPSPTLVDRALAGRRDSLALLRLSLEAHDLAAKERFDDLLCLAQLQGVERFWYQVETVRRVLRTFRGRVLLADEVGLGKTIEAGMVLKEYLLRGMVKTALVLVPPSLVPQWRAELSGKLGIDAGGSDDREFAADPDAYLDSRPVVVASLALARREGHRERFASRRTDLVIVDEAHRIKDHKSASHELVSHLKSRFLLLLTATPVENDLMELYNLVTLLKPGQLRTRQSFREEFVDRGDPTAPRNRERLRALLREVMVRNTRALADARLPPRVAVTVVVDGSPAERELYEHVLSLVRERGRELGASFLAAAGSHPQALAATADRLAARTPAFAALAERARAVRVTHKDERLLEVIRAADKTVVFTRFVATCEHLIAFLAARGIEAAVYRGGMSAAEKDAAVASFRERVPVLVSTDVGAEGLNLQFAASLVNYDLPWNPARIEQRIGRLHRIGQTREVKVWNLCSRGTAEDRLLEVLDGRLNLFELVVGEMDMVLGYVAADEDFEEMVAGIYRESKSEAEVSRGFEGIARALLAARQRYDRVKRFDTALLGEDYAL